MTTDPNTAALARIRQMADHWEQHLPEVIRTPAVVSALRAALESAEPPAAGLGVSATPSHTDLRQRIAEALYRHEWPHKQIWQQALAMDRETFEAMAAAVLAVLPPPADRAAVLREAEAKAREVVARLWDDGTTQTAMDRAGGARAVEWEIGLMASGINESAPDFFQPGHSYTHRDGSTFRCVAVTTHPDGGERVAIGWHTDTADWTFVGVRNINHWNHEYDGVEAPADDLRRLADQAPLSPYYEHPECGFHWHGRDGLDIPMRDGQPVCPRCELAKVQKKLDYTQRRRDEVGAECKRRGKITLEQAERIARLERQLDEVRTQLGAEILRAGQAEAALGPIQRVIRRLANHAVGFQDVIDDSDRDPWAKTVGADIAELRRLADEAQQQPTTETPRCALCTHPKSDHDGRADHRAKYPPLVAGDPWCHACNAACDYAPAEQPEPSVHGESVAALAGYQPDGRDTWGGDEPAADKEQPVTPAAHYRRDDGVECCVHTIPVGPNSCPACRELADDDGPAAGPSAVDEVVAALQAKAQALSVEAEEEMRRDLEEQAQVWHEAADLARRTGRKAARRTQPAVDARQDGAQDRG